MIWEKDRVVPLWGARCVEIGGQLAARKPGNLRETKNSVAQLVYALHEADEGFQDIGPIGEGLECQDKAKKGCVCVCVCVCETPPYLLCIILPSSSLLLTIYLL